MAKNGQVPCLEAGVGAPASNRIDVGLPMRTNLVHDNLVAEIVLKGDPRIAFQSLGNKTINGNQLHKIYFSHNGSFLPLIISGYSAFHINDWYATGLAHQCKGRYQRHIRTWDLSPIGECINPARSKDRTGSLCNYLEQP